jgi:tetratricopeptide (TPR) repeat protein
MESTFRLSALGIQPGRDPQAVRAELQPMLKGDAAAFEDIFHRISLSQQVVLGENISRTKAQNLLEKLTVLGLKCRIDPMQLTLEPIEEDQQDTLYQCPACGHRQPPKVGNDPDICERCGIVGRNYGAASELKQAMDLERRRIKSLMSREEEEEKREADRKRQEKLRAIAKHQIEREMGITGQDKIKALLAPRVLIPILSSISLAAAGVGLLVWQLQGSSTHEATAVDASKPAGLQLTVTPAPGAVFKVEGTSPQVAQDSAGAQAPGTAAAVTASADAQSNAATPATSATSATPVASATSTTGRSEAGTVTTATASQAGNTAVNATPSSDAPAQPVPLLNVNQLALATPADGSASGKAARDPQLLTHLARYQSETGDLAGAIRSIDRAIELLSAERSSLSSSQLDAFNRAQAEVRAGIARQYHQRREVATAQTYWFRATNLANSMTTPSERARALSVLARTLNEAQASTAEDYFNRAIEVARLITEPFDQALVLGAIARDLALTGHLEQSQRLFDQAAAAVKAMPNSEGQWVAQALLAKHRAEAGDTVVAKVLLGQIAGEAQGDRLPPELGQHQAEAFSALALSLVGRGETAIARADFAAALQQAQALPDPTLRAGTLLYLARDIAVAGDRAAAAKLVAAAGTWNGAHASEPPSGSTR